MDHDAAASARIAVLFDADNISPKKAEAILDELAKYGTPTIKRAYGDFSSQRLSGWTKELNARAIRAIHQNAYTVHKNSTDSALIIDAMDLLYAGNVEAFAIVSSDSDFTGLALRLRESGRTVYGLGRRRTPQSLQNACDKFIQLEVLGEDDGDDDHDREDPPRQRGGGKGAGGDHGSDAETDQDSDEAPAINLQSVLTKAVNANADDDGWARISSLGNHITRTHANFDPRTFGHGKLSSLVAAQPYLEATGSGNEAKVRLKGQTRKATAPRTTQRAAKKTSRKAAEPTEPPEDAPAKEPSKPTVTKTTRTRKSAASPAKKAAKKPSGT